MKKHVRRILDEYDEGRITATGFILDLLGKVNHADLKECWNHCRWITWKECESFVEIYRPDMKVFRGPPPDPARSRLLRKMLAGMAKSTSGVFDPSR